jgi:iron complex transport system permease protein
MLGYVLSLVIFGHGDNLLLIFGMSIIGTLIFIQFIHRVQFKNAIFVPLVGIIFGNVVSSVATFLAYKYDAVQNLSAWTVANFANILQGNYELLYIAVPISIISYWYATRLSAVGMGKDFATNIGLNYKQILFIGIMLVSVMSATVVMIVGQLPFLGLIVPNLVTQFYGDNLRKNIPLTAIVGAILILVCDVVGRIVIFPYEIPISMIISILGGVVFIAFIVKGKQHV